MIISRQIPDLVVFPVFCSAADEARIAARVGALSVRRSAHAGYSVVGVHGCRNARHTSAMVLLVQTAGRNHAEGHRDSGAFADEIRDYLATEPGDASIGLFREFAARRGLVGGKSGGGGFCTSDPGEALRTQTEHPLDLARANSPPRWRRSVGAALLLARRRCRLLRERSWRGSQHSDRTLPQLAPATVATDVAAVWSGRRCCWLRRQCRPRRERFWTRLSELRLEHPFVRRQRTSPPRWRRSVGAALLLVSAVTIAMA